MDPFNLAGRQGTGHQGGLRPSARSVFSIVRCVARMKRIFSHPLTALAAGLCLRLFFVLKFPANSGDTALYQQIAANWLKHHVYAMDVGGTITPVDLRMPGYPAFLSLIYAMTGRTGAEARLWVMLAQIAIDLLACLLIARLAVLLACNSEGIAANPSVKRAALWLAVLCPFTANYTAVQLTEVFAVLWTVLACNFIVIGLRRVEKPDFLSKGSHLRLRSSVNYTAFGAGLIVGLGTLFRPETPLLLVAAAIVFCGLFLFLRSMGRWFSTSFAMALGCLLILSPWALRNFVSLGELQFLAPKNSNLPGELVPHGFLAWEKTWLYRVRDCNARHPLRTYILLPAARAFTIWFTPRIELLPVSGNVFPLAQMREDDPVDQEVTSALFILNLFYAGIGVWGAAWSWRSNPATRPALSFLVLFILIRTAFLTTLETPEPRYVLVCFPALIAMGAQLFAGRSEALQHRQRTEHPLP